MKFFNRNILSSFDWFLILGIIVLNVIYSFLMQDLDIMGTLAGVSGVICVVLVAKRSIVNYFFGLVNVSLYAIISYKSGIYGDALLNAFYYLPMQFIGWYGWIRHSDNQDNSSKEVDVSIVKSRRMSKLQRVLLFLGSGIAVAVTGLILSRWTEDPQPYKDAATTVLSIIAQFLMVRMFLEQWFLWIIVNVISVAMWVYLWIEGEHHAALMVGMWAFYLANSINGFRVWRKSASDTVSAKD